MIEKWIIPESDKWNFWEKTAMFIYAYYPEYYTNSYEHSIQKRAKAIIYLRDNEKTELQPNKIRQEFLEFLKWYEWKVRDYIDKNWKKIKIKPHVKTKKKLWKINKK